MHYVVARLAAAAILVTAALFLVSSVSAYAKSDPDHPNGTHDGLLNNPGHHYGQLKHQTPPPAPGPAPTPAPSPQPSPGRTTAARPATGIGSTSMQNPAQSLPNLSASWPVIRLGGDLKLGRALEASGGLDWLLLLVLPLLLAVWVMVFARMLRRARTLRPAAQLAPANT